MKRYLVTGASGFLGSACLPLLIESGYEVHAVSRVARDDVGVTWHRADLLNENPARLLELIQPTHLLHLAWIADPGEFWESPLNSHWLTSSRALLDAFGGARVVMAGTCAEYDWQAGLCHESDTPLKPISAYSRAKAELSRDLVGCPTSSAWARMFWPFGPGEPQQKLVASVVQGLLAGRPVPCTEGLQRRDFMYIDDVAGALVALCDSEVTGPVNIGSGQAIAVRDLVLPFATALGRRDLIEFGARPSNSAEPPLVVADVTRLAEEVAYQPRVSLAQAIDQTIAYWKHHG